MPLMADPEAAAPAGFVQPDRRQLLLAVLTRCPPCWWDFCPPRGHALAAAGDGPVVGLAANTAGAGHLGHDHSLVPHAAWRGRGPGLPDLRACVIQMVSRPQAQSCRWRWSTRARRRACCWRGC
ncbi:hypothetical protein ACU4GD_42425 [Cupriavidus basilensis]